MALPQIDIQQMTIDERIELAEALWDSLAASPEAFPLTHEQAEELDRRVEVFERDGDYGTPWSTVQAGLRERRG
jgi:putative addiction module component (TIGR02574 family)